MPDARPHAVSPPPRVSTPGPTGPSSGSAPGSSGLLSRATAALACVGEALYDRTCPSCEARLPGLRGASRGLCDLCLEALVEADHPSCPRCAALDLDLAPRPDARPCAACTQRPPPWATATALFAWGGPLRDAVTAWKNRPAHHLSRPLCALFADHAVARGVLARPTDLIVPIPSPRPRLSARGFNTAGLLARSLAEVWQGRHRGPRPRLAPRGLAIRADRLGRSSQGADRALRAARVLGAFEAAAEVVEGARVLLVDDVMTTGATLKSATEALLAARAREVSVCVLARVPRPSSGSAPGSSRQRPSSSAAAGRAFDPG